MMQHPYQSNKSSYLPEESLQTLINLDIETPKIFALKLYHEITETIGSLLLY